MNHSASYIANYAREHGITLTEAMHILVESETTEEEA